MRLKRYQYSTQESQVQLATCGDSSESPSQQLPSDPKCSNLGHLGMRPFLGLQRGLQVGKVPSSPWLIDSFNPIHLRCS